MTIRRAHVWTATGLDYITIEGDWPDTIQRGPYLLTLDRFADGKPAIRHGRMSGVEIVNYYPIRGSAARAASPSPPADPPAERIPHESNRTHVDAGQPAARRGPRKRTAQSRGRGRGQR